MMEMLLFSENLKAWRTSKGFTQEELAQRSHIPRPNLVALEQGRRECTLTTLHRLAYALGVSSGTLLDQGPKEESFVEVDRHAIDDISRHILSNQPIHLKNYLVPIRNAALPHLKSLLRVAGIRRRSKIDQNLKGVNPQVLEQVLKRTRKLLYSKIQGAL